MIYAPSDLTSITVPAGCGQPHEVAPVGEHRGIDCPACEPFLVGLGWKFAHDPAGVGKTCDEIAAEEAAETASKRRGNQLMANPLALIEMMRQGAAPGAGPKGLLEELVAMPKSEKRALASMLRELLLDGDEDEPGGAHAEPAPVEPGSSPL
jgi:hypothetical protein